VGSVNAIHESLYNVLAVAERALAPYTVALLWMDADDNHLRVKELRSQADHITERPIGAGEGLVGAITKRREPLVLKNLRHGHAGLVYYDRPQEVTQFAGVPILEGVHLRGVLVADRTDDRPFEDADLAVMKTIGQEIVRAVVVERIFSDMDSDKFQRERFYEASRAFNRALTVDEVARVAIEASLRVAEADFAAIAVALPKRHGVLRIQRVQRLEPFAREKSLEGFEFSAEDGLVGAAIKARHPLPYGTARLAPGALFDGKRDVGLPFVKVLPLLWKESGVGALILGGKSDNFLPHDVLDMLQVIADHAAIAIANAQMYERMEHMATTDGLTGLTNHRHFQERFDEQLERAQRYGRKVSLILLDIDYFKTVNDTYGHPAGDTVLRKVARLLESCARKSDVVARYGGEEFALLLDETGLEGAVNIGERIRQVVEAEIFHNDIGSFSCTVSLGVSTFPKDADKKALLIEGADKALYSAKGGGRNRVVTFEGLGG